MKVDAAILGEISNRSRKPVYSTSPRITVVDVIAIRLPGIFFLFLNDLIDAPEGFPEGIGCAVPLPHAGGEYQMILVAIRL